MTRRSLLVLGTAMCAALAACNDIPLLPRWEADWVLPLPSQTIALLNQFGGATVPPNTSFPVDFPVQQQSLADALDNFQLDQTLRSPTSVTITVSKPATASLAINATLYVGSSAAALNDTDPSTVRLPVAIAAAGTAVTDTVTLTTTQLDMVKQVAGASGSLYVQLRGTATSGPSGYTFSSADSLYVRAQLLARVAMSR